jgi:hypothetical protein
VRDFTTRLGTGVSVRPSCSFPEKGLVVLSHGDGEPLVLYPSDVGRLVQLLKSRRRLALAEKRRIIEGE